MDNVTVIAPIGMAPPLVAAVGVVGAGVARMLGRRRLAVGLGIIALAAMAYAVIWTISP